MGLERISPNNKRPAVRQLGVGCLQLDLLAAQDGPVLAPVELEGLTCSKHQGHECTTTTGLLLMLPFYLPAPDEGRNPAIGTIIAQHDEIGVHLLGRALLLTRFASFLTQPACQLVGKRGQFTGPNRNLELRLHHISSQIFADRIPRQPRPPLDLANGDVLPEMPATDHTE